MGHTAQMNTVHRDIGVVTTEQTRDQPPSQCNDTSTRTKNTDIYINNMNTSVVHEADNNNLMCVVMTMVVRLLGWRRWQTRHSSVTRSLRHGDTLWSQTDSSTNIYRSS